MIIALVLSGCFHPEANAAPINFIHTEIKPTEIIQESSSNEADNTIRISEPTAITTKILPTVPPTPEPAPDLYGCEMRIEFSSGPLKDQISEFQVLDEKYFEEKSDKFAVGKGTAVYYESQPYLILHSSYVNGNVLQPMEAELIRKYLEQWGRNGNEFIQNQIDSLNGSQVKWYCNNELIIETKINSIVRLSHEASNRLWLEPTQLEDILEDKEGLTSEWIGEITPIDEPGLYLGFCGWGPPNLEAGRYTYFRYLLKFTIQYP